MNSETRQVAAYLTIALAMAIVVSGLCQRYTFYAVPLTGGGHIQVRGDRLTGQLKQVYIRDP